MPATRTIADRAADPLMTALVQLKPRLSEGITYLATHGHDPARFEAGQRRLLRIAVREYLPALRDLAASTDRRELHRRRMTLKRRLNRGWSLDEDPAVLALFGELVLQYEICTDALRLEHPDPDKRPLAVIQNRMRRIELALIRAGGSESRASGEEGR